MDGGKRPKTKKGRHKLCSPPLLLQQEAVQCERESNIVQQERRLSLHTKMLSHQDSGAALQIPASQGVELVVR